MNFLVKKPGDWTWKPLTTDSLKREVEAGRVGGDWRIRLQDEVGESSVEELLRVLKGAAAPVRPAVTDLKDVLLIGTKNRVAAISKGDGRELWSTELSSEFGQGFVTLLCDGARVFAYAGGHLHCLELVTGRLLWTNELPGYGFGVASLCFPHGISAPDMATLAGMIEVREASKQS